MASEVKPKKPKGILKASSSFDQPDHNHPDRKEMKWDEMNILATHHPADKDYGHMKIDEPKTPYNRMSDSEDNDGENRRHSVSDETDVDPLSNLASRLEQVDDKGQSVDEEESSSEEEEELTEDEKAKRRVFEQKRKLHYNEFQAVKLAKQLMEEEDDEDEEDETDDKVQDQSGDKVQDQDSTTPADSTQNNI